MLEASGYEEEANGVHIGTFGNFSTTKECRSFAASIDINKHTLKDENGEKCQFNLEKDEVEHLYELVPHSEPSGKHIHLKLIDTPGLDDSDNAKENEGSNGSNGAGMKIRVVDERHKLAVLKTLANVG